MTTYTEFNSDMFLCNSLDSLTVYTRNNDIKYISKSLKDATFYYIGGFSEQDIAKLKTFLKSKYYQYLKITYLNYQQFSFRS